MKTVAIIVALFAVGYQPADTNVLPAPLRTHVQAERFAIVTSIRGLPLGVRDALQALFGGALDIAEPGAEFQGNAANSILPTRRLVAAGCSADHHCLVYYERGGPRSTWHVTMFHWTPEATRFEWGGDAVRTYATVEDVRKAILAGEIRNHAGVW